MRYVIGLALAGIVSTQALAVGRIADVTVIDRDTGQALRAHHYKGEYWVAGRPGAHYSIQINSRDGRRLLAVTSVDGVNILTGEDAGVLQRGYVFDPFQGYGVAGWRKSDSEIAAFTFTSIPKSYAARTGRPANVGVIGVALFAEKQYVPRVSQVAPRPPETLSRSEPRARAQPQSAAEAESFELAEVTVAGSRIHSEAANAAADASADRSASGGAGAENQARREEKAARAPAPSLGTGHGRREYSAVTNVPFERASSTPDEVIRIRYDSRDNLVALGVIRRPPPPPAPKRLDPFPESPRMGYVPDP